MTKTAVKDPLDAARSAVASPVGYETFLERLGPKGKLNAERHIAACELEPHPGHAKLWKQLSCTLMTLATHSAKFNGQQSLQFYVADGKYRMQVFAMEDLRAATVAVYCRDVVDRALKAGLLKAPKKDAAEPNAYGIADSSETLGIDRLDGSSSDPGEFYKDMLGWNRKAIRITLPVTANSAQIHAVELLCALSMPGSNGA